MTKVPSGWARRKGGADHKASPATSANSASAASAASADGAASAANVADVVHATALRTPHDPALVGAWGTRTWAELDDAITAGAAALAAAPFDLKPGERVVVALPNGLELAAALFATLRAGLVVVPVDPIRTDLAWVAARVDARVTISESAGAAITPAQIADWWSAKPTGEKAEYDVFRGVAEGEDLALLARGSRSGPPVMLSHRAILAAAHAVAAAAPAGLGRVDRVLQVLPLFHVVGLVTAFLPAALAGAAVVVPDVADAASRVDAAVQAVRTHRVSVLPAEPTLYRQLDRVAGFERALGTVRLMTSGSSPLDPADFAAIRAATGQSVREGYGISEASGAVSSTLVARVAKPGSSGLPYPGVEIRIDGDEDADVDSSDAVDDEGLPAGRAGDGGADGASRRAADGSASGGSDGGADPVAGSSSGAADDDKASPAKAEPAPAGNTDFTEGITDLVEVTGPGEDVGRIAIRGATLFSGYWPDGSGGPDADGWFQTGDIGYLDDAGELHLVDRATETITVSGFTVYPREVEDVLANHPHIADAAVVSVPGRAGQSVVAVVVATPGTRPTIEDVSEFVAAAGLAPFKRPTDYLVVDELPRTEVGRLDRSAVRTVFAAARGIELDEGEPDGDALRTKPTPLWRRLPGTARGSRGARRGAHDTDDDLF